MKRSGSNKTVWYINIVLVVCFLLVSNSMAQTGGPYDLEWSAISGGGISTGGPYVLNGTIGQTNTAYSSAGQYEILVGFWPGWPECFVDFELFAKFAEYWLDTGTGLPADLYEDQNNIVDLIDFEQFINEWLYYCPSNWPLK